MDTIRSLTAGLEAEPTGLVEVREELRKGKGSFFSWIYGTVETGTVTFNATYEQAQVEGCLTNQIRRAIKVLKLQIPESLWTSPVPIQSGHTYGIRVVAERGSKDAVYWEA